MPLAVGVQVRRTKDIIYCDPGSADFAINTPVLVETENGLEVGVVMSQEQMRNTREPIRRIARVCKADDFRQIKRNLEEAKKVMQLIADKIEILKLHMNLSMVEYTFERMKVFIYYTAEERVDFRELIKELGTILRTRVQMVQIGVRDEVKILGSLGHCGQLCCCQRFLKDFTSVTSEMVKEQNLTINPAKISGVCGRLMCCLSYEHQYYVNASKKLPAMNSRISTPDGKGKVTGVNVFNSEITVTLEDGRTNKYNAKDLK